MSDDNLHHPAHPCGRVYRVESALRALSRDLALKAELHEDIDLLDLALAIGEHSYRLRALRHDLSRALP